MRKFLFFFAMVAVVLSMASCGDGGNTPEQPDQPEQPKPVGAIKGKFSVAPGKQVYFSKGNLQATTGDKGNSWTWSFAENQWDIIGNQVANNAINGNRTVSTNGTVDLFGWSSHKNYYGIHNSQVQGDYIGPCKDWGNNPISNGGNQPNLWRTLTNDEWAYLLQTREDAANKYGVAKVHDIPGVVFLPDEWTTLPSGLKFTPGRIKGAAQYDWSTVPSKNIYDIDQWDAMEKKGAVFLPAAGFRYGTEVNYVESVGYYWSSTFMVSGNGMGYFFAFYGPGDILPNQYNSGDYPYGQPVRLVQDVK